MPVKGSYPSCEDFFVHGPELAVRGRGNYAQRGQPHQPKVAVGSLAEVVEGLLRAIERRRFQQQQRGREVAPPVQEEEASERDERPPVLARPVRSGRAPGLGGRAP